VETKLIHFYCPVQTQRITHTMQYNVPAVCQMCNDSDVSLGIYTVSSSGVPRNFVRGGGVQQIQLRTEGRENGDLVAVAPLVRGSAQFAIRFDFVKLPGCRGLLRVYFPRNWEFGSTLSKIRNFAGGGVFEPPKPPFGTPLLTSEEGSSRSHHVDSSLWKRLWTCRETDC
jgi:hypothetical protein